jgi:iron complex transport system permease protein
MFNKLSYKNSLIILLLSLLLIALISLLIGRYEIKAQQLYYILTFNNKDISNEAQVVVWVIRMPRIIMGILIGMALAVSGAVYQGLFKNPLVSPDILGVSSGAAVGASIAIVLSLGQLGVQLMAFLFGLLAVILVVFLSSLISKGKINIIVMILSGIVISSLFSASTSMIKYLADSEDQLPEITFWLMGSLARTSGYDNVLTMFIIFLISIIPLFLLRWKLNILAFGDEAKTLGVNTKLYSAIIIVCSTLLTASVVAFCGIIGWIGLIIPHMARFLVGPNFIKLLPTSMLIGAIFTLIVDNFSRSLIVSEIPIGILTSFIGAPLFIYLLYKSKKGWQ